MKHRAFYFLRVLALIFGLGSIDIYANDIAFTCNVEYGFNFQRDLQGTIGYITSLTIGTTTLSADLKVTDPITSTATQAVAVLSDFSWNSAYNGPLAFQGQISSTNKQILAMLLSKSLTSSQVQIGFKIFDYDPKAASYFPALVPSTSAGLKGTLVPGTLPTVEATPDGTVKVPQNFKMTLQIAPQSIAQSMQYATADKMIVVKKWGLPPPPPNRRGLPAGEDR